MKHRDYFGDGVGLVDGVDEGIRMRGTRGLVDFAGVDENTSMAVTMMVRCSVSVCIALHASHFVLPFS